MSAVPRPSGSGCVWGPNVHGEADQRMDQSLVESLQSSLVILIALIVGVLSAQTILMGVFVLAFRKWSAHATVKIDALTASTLPALQSLRDLIEESRNRFHSIGANLEEISALTRRQVQKVDNVMSDVTERAQMQLVRLDGLVADTIDKVERTTDVLQRGVVKPVHEISALMTGVKTAVDYLRTRNRGPHHHSMHDEEMFI